MRKNDILSCRLVNDNSILLSGGLHIADVALANDWFLPSLFCDSAMATGMKVINK